MRRLMRTFMGALITTAIAAVPIAASAAANEPAAQPAVNPVASTDQKPVLGWSSWESSFANVTAAKVEAEARAMSSSGLAKLGYQYINVDGGWYDCPGEPSGPPPNADGFPPPPGGWQGPAVDQWGNWMPDPTKFPEDGSTNGIKAVADYIHSRGLKFGIYFTHGISKQAVLQNTPVEGNVDGHLTGKPSGYTAAQIATTTTEDNYDCGGNNSDAGGMLALNYSSPGAQIYMNSLADELASWGVDFVKLDGTRYPRDVRDIQAWSEALRQTGRPIKFDVTEGYTTKIAPTVEKYATQWMDTVDMDCYDCDTGLPYGDPPVPGHFQLTKWTDPAQTSLCNYQIVPHQCDSPTPSNFTTYAGQFEPYTQPGGWSLFPHGVVERFNFAAGWKQYASPGHFNDFDAVPVGNGSVDGISVDARKTVLSLWSLGASPLILGSDLRYLDPGDLALLKNRAVLAVDQDGIAARQIRNTPGEQEVFAKTEPNGDVIVGLFNTNMTTAQEISVTPSEIGLPSGAHYTLDDLWSHHTSSTFGQITSNVPPEGVALFKVTRHGH